MNPAMIATWVLGLTLALHRAAAWTAGWLWVKLCGVVLALTAFHGWCAARRRDFAEGAQHPHGPHLPHRQRGADAAAAA